MSNSESSSPSIEPGQLHFNAVVICPVEGADHIIPAAVWARNRLTITKLFHLRPPPQLLRLWSAQVHGVGEAGWPWPAIHSTVPTRKLFIVVGLLIENE